MFTLTEEQRQSLLKYMWARPYGEVAANIAMLASLKAIDALNIGAAILGGIERE